MERIECKAAHFSIYFEGQFPGYFQRVYKGVVVNARGYWGYGHFAIRKPITFWFNLPRFIKRLFPYKWVMWKNDREKLNRLFFNDHDRSISIDAEMTNPSCRKLTFDKNTYNELKENIPDFLKEVGYKFKTDVKDDVMTLIFEPVTETERPKAPIFSE